MAASHRFAERDVTYLEHAGKPLLARLYQPEGAGPFPAIVSVHGGAWTSGDRFQNAAIDGYLAGRGIVVLSLDFRMPPEAGYPAAVADVNAGIRWLKAHAGEVHSRPELVGVLGSSSGGQTMLLDLLRPTDPRYAALPVAGGQDARVAFAVACWPIADPLARYRMAKQKGNAKLVEAHDAYWGDEAAMTEGNPTLLLGRGEPATTVPLLVIQGTADENVTPDMADRFVAAYRAAGGEAELEKYEGEGHSFIKGSDSANVAGALERIAGFILDRAAQPVSR